MIMAKYEYSPLDSAGSQFRLLTLPFEIKEVLRYRHNKPLTGSLKHYYLPSPSLPRAERIKRSTRMPIFKALSYVWGNDSRSHEILIDGRPLSITANLHAALRDLQSESAFGDCVVWADAICINQDDFAERSAQIRLMRDVFHLAANVRVWLGPRTDEMMRCAKFITYLNGRSWPEDSTDDEPSIITETAMKAIFLPTGAIINAGYGFGQTLVNVGDIIMPSYRDDKAKMILDPNSNLSLHLETIQKLTSWRPSTRNLKRVQYEKDFIEIAHLIDTALLQRSDWFGRMWVVQEVGVADDVSLQIGNYALSWDSFLKVVHYLNYTWKVPMNIRKLTGLEKIRLGWNDGKRQPLRELLWDTRYRSATDPRDKIYSLLGLMGDPMSNLLLPNYTKSVNEVYANAALHILTQSSSLDSICGQQILGRRDDLPSWVPDYSLNQDLAAASLVHIDGRESIFAASGYDYHSRFLVSDISATSHSWDTLHATGLLVDIITHTSDPAPEDGTFGAIENQWHSSLFAASRLLEGFTEDVCHCLVDISTVVNQYCDYYSSKGVNSNLPKETEPDPLMTEIYILDAYIQALLCGRISSSERVTKEEIRAIMGFQSLDKSSPTQHREFVIKVCNAFEAGMRRRKLAVTKNGYIGAVPQESLPDDIICVLFGCSVPVVLRRGATSDATGKVSYKFIGEAYLHGFMDAEAIAMLVKGIFKVQDFMLR